MIAIYRGEDTDFAGQEPFQIEIKTNLDLTGYTAKILFGSIVKEYGPEDVGTKILPLSFSADETSTFFPGRGFASVKVYDTENRVAVLKRFVIDVRFRKYETSRYDQIDVSEMLREFENVRQAAKAIPRLMPEDDTTTIKSSINALLDAARERDEFEPINLSRYSKIPRQTIDTFCDCMKKLEELAVDTANLSGGDDTEEIKEVFNKLLSSFAGANIAPDIEQGGEEDLLKWSRHANRILRTQIV